MIGLRTRSIASVCGVNRSVVKASTKLNSDIILMSAPAAKAFSEPVRMMQRTLSFFCAWPSASASSSSSLSFSAFSASGRLSVMVWTWSSVSTMIVS